MAERRTVPILLAGVALAGSLLAGVPLAGSLLAAAPPLAASQEASQEAAGGQSQAADGQSAPESTRSWEVGVWVQAGYQRPSGKFAGNSASDAPSLGIVETVAELGGSPVASGGLEVLWPASEIGVRIGWETTRGAEAVGQISVCRLVEGRLCRQETAPVDLRGFLAQLRLFRGNPERPIRGVISGGLAVRQYSFSIPTCPDQPGTDTRIVCDAITDIYQNAGSHVVFRGGIGVQGRASRLVSELTASAGMGRYNGGGERTNGNWYLDVRFELSAGVTIL